MQGSQIPDSKIINEIKYSKKKESDVLLIEKILTINKKLDAQTKKAIDNASQPGAPGIVTFHLSSIAFP